MPHYYARGAGGKTARLIEWDRKECFNTPGHGGHPKHSLEFPAFLLKRCVSFLSSVLVPTHPIQYFMSSLSNAFNIIGIWAFLQTALKFPHPLQFPTSLLQTQRRTQAFLKLAISLHRLGNVAHWQTVFVVGVGRWWSCVFFFSCMVRGGTNGALNRTRGGTHHPARRLNLRKYPPPLTDKPYGCCLELDAVRF